MELPLGVSDKERAKDRLHHVLAVGAGGLIGSWLGAARFSIIGLRRALAFVLVLAAAKLVFLS